MTIQTGNCERCIAVDEHLHMTDDGQAVCPSCFQELGYELAELQNRLEAA